MQNNRGKAGKPRNSSIFNKKRNEIHASPPQIDNSSDHGHEAKLLIQISHLSAKSASTQEISTFESFASFSLF